MENTLITPSEVIAAAFRPSDFVREQSVSASDILAAEQKFIAPVLGGLLDALHQGLYPTLLSGYITAPLALYVKAQVLPRLWMQSSEAGVVQIKSDTMTSASEVQMRGLVRCAIRQADTLMRRAVRHIESSPEQYPEYDAEKNVSNRCSILGGIIIADDGTDI